MSWQTQAKNLLHLCWYATRVELDRKFASSVVDRTLRASSDIISAENVSVVNNTASVLQWCKYWSVEALELYYRVEKELSEQKGKPPSHRQVTQERDEQNKRYWTVEHQYPILIPKTNLLDNNWSEQTLVDWMFKYGKATIVTQEENDRLLPYTQDMDLASKRYNQANITITTHPKLL